MYLHKENNKILWNIMNLQIVNEIIFITKAVTTIKRGEQDSRGKQIQTRGE